MDAPETERVLPRSRSIAEPLPRRLQRVSSRSSRTLPGTLPSSPLALTPTAWRGEQFGVVSAASAWVVSEGGVETASEGVEGGVETASEGEWATSSGMFDPVESGAPQAD